MLGIKEQSVGGHDQWIGPAPWIDISPPGPLARTAIERDGRVAASCYARQHPLVVRRASGTVVEDVDGNRFLDFAAGMAVCSVGHGHPRVVEAIEKQLHELIHVCGTAFRYEPMIALSEKLAALAPGPAAKRVFLTNSGTEAIEAAIKLVRWHTRRPWIISFRGAFHGRTTGALALTSSEYRLREGFGPLLPMIAHAPYGDVEAIRDQLFGLQMAPEEVAAIFVQPLQSEGGFTLPPDGFLPALRRLCDKHGILMVVDENQCGLGRSGKMFACQQFGITPDVLVISHGLASGMPLGAVIAPEKVMTWPSGAHGSTYGGNPIACAAALATLELLESGLIASGAAAGQHLRGYLNDLTGRNRHLRDVRGLGLLLGVDVVNRRTGRPSAVLRDRVLGEAFRRGLILLGCGDTSIRFSPPLTINKAQLEVGIGVLEEAVATVAD
ncbi:MAG: aminotransferase class III-fold pyridoxal phosphate-dependent enzyme [bacterium]|nr:aminotransferase class III-fold pyridoxal phosphate-dependent enzyme [bacterium]